jgi:integrase
LLDRELKKVEPVQEQAKTFLGFFQEIIDKTKAGTRLQPTTGKPYSKATIQVYMSTLNRIIEFAATQRRTVDFSTIDLEFYSDFTGYLTKHLKLASNTIGKDIKTIKTILNEATERGINKNLQYKSRKVSVTSESTDAIYLTEAELDKLETLDLSGNKRLENIRDLFLIGCYTGLRFSDWASLKPAQIKDGCVEITQLKTDHSIVVPIHPTVQRILDKYNGNLPRSISNQKANEYLKELGRIVPAGENEPVLNAITSKTLTKGGSKVTVAKYKWEALCTHTARRSFATNEYLAGMPSITIMAITGHKTEQAFLRYIKLTPSEHAKLMQIHWQSRKSLRAV